MLQGLLLKLPLPPTTPAPCTHPSTCTETHARPNAGQRTHLGLSPFAQVAAPAAAQIQQL